LSETFKFDNPNVSATCGCGESFSIDKQAGAVA
jgi:Fe-S cluster assembly iron-binding protein IscA